MARNSNPYLALGVRPIINCCAVRTLYGGSLMLPQVKEAMAEASRQFVNLDELMEAAGQRLAELTQAEWGMVTCGSAAAMALATAACIAGNDPVKMLRLPFTDGMVNRVIMLRNQRFAYDQAIRMAGAHVVEIGTRAELDAALAEPVAMIAVLGNVEAKSAVRLEELVAVARPRGIPVMVDAASEQLERPSPYLARGADLVVYSGGKYLRGPQTSGLLLGSKVLLQAAWRNASPHQSLGRPMKVSKEDVIGCLAAVEHWFETRDAAAELRRWRADLQTIADRVARIADAVTDVIEPAGVEKVPKLRILWDTKRIPIDGDGLRRRLLEGAPRIMLDDTATSADTIVIDPFALQPGEAEAVGVAIALALTHASREKPRTPEPPVAAEITGEWDLRVKFLRGERAHRLLIEQRGSEISGHQHSPDFDSPVVGRLTPEGVDFSFDYRYEGSRISYRFLGQANGRIMTGTVVLGAVTDHHQGTVNLSQFGGGDWQASRVVPSQPGLP
ncbi:MAG TPA: aminotransferase class V-fold PLP-dependent enzyme [Stellaceae bacterium]|nr:aminotransferase class V-fold PLP-dependent enzyme [Stellaceae bacterium]